MISYVCQYCGKTIYRIKGLNGEPEEFLSKEKAFQWLAEQCKQFDDKQR